MAEQSLMLRWKVQGQTMTRPLSEANVVIGRRSDSDIVLLDPYISRQHARVLLKDGDFILEDLNSSHGTFVNGQRISERPLTPGDRIELGQGRIEIEFVRTDDKGDGSTTIGDEELKQSIMDLSSVIPADSGHSEIEKISHLLNFKYQLERTFSAEKTFQQLLNSALEISGAERGFILIQKDRGFEYVVGLNGRGQLLSESEFQTSRSVVEQVSQQGQALFMTEGIDQQFAGQESILAMHLRAVACMPLLWMSATAESRTVRGILYLDSTKTMHALSGLDEQILNKLADEAANVFEKLEMIKSFEERKAVEKELALAQETQRTLLPQVLPTFESYGVQAFSQATRYVGGDFYDVFPTASGDLAAVLADVSGKGVSAALLSSFVQGALEAAFRTSGDLEEVLNDLNRFLCQRTQSNRFVTLFLVSMDAAGQGAYVSAGHNPVYLYRAESGIIEELTSDDLILGAFEFARYRSMPLSLKSGDIVFIYSDGVTEAMNPEGEMFGEERLKQALIENANLGAAGLHQRLLDALDEFTGGTPQTDDLTVLLLERQR